MSAADCILAAMSTTPRESDPKINNPIWAHERCKQVGCGLRPWGLGTVTPDDPRNCAYHEGMSDAALIAMQADVGDMPALEGGLVELRRLQQGRLYELLVPPGGDGAVLMTVREACELLAALQSALRDDEGAGPTT
jgi:hypothetical protein